MANNNRPIKARKVKPEDILGFSINSPTSTIWLYDIDILYLDVSKAGSILCYTKDNDDDPRLPVYGAYDTKTHIIRVANNGEHVKHTTLHEITHRIAPDCDTIEEDEAVADLSAIAILRANCICNIDETTNTHLRYATKITLTSVRLAALAAERLCDKVKFFDVYKFVCDNAEMFLRWRIIDESTVKDIKEIVLLTR